MSRSRFHVVIAGGGVAGLEAALALQAIARDDVSVEIVAPEVEFTYRPLAVSEPFEKGEVKRFPLHALAEAAGARLRPASLAAVDADEKTVRLDDGTRVGYDALLLTVGAVPRDAVDGALTFRGAQDGAALAALLARATTGDVRSLTFAVPSGTTWPLPLYELALMTAMHLTDHVTNGSVAVVTPEDHPLAIFGPTASTALAELLDLRGIAFEHSVTPVEWRDGKLRVVPERWIATDAVVSLPRLEGPRIPGLPQDSSGFLPTDEYGWVLGVNDVYAAGDVTQFPLKQGGIATQQADAAASAIAADAGVDVRPEEFRPVLRGLLLTGFVPRFLRADVTGAGSTIDTEPLWWPPAKIVGRHLAPFLAEHLGLAEALPDELRMDAVPVDVELDRVEGRPLWSRV
ncbi:MAG: hypothetical protein E6G13_14000 [Actinobacteria bacterium]|nr:MAG: hypothetical protein E6G13_14000 [Actinomycetota bacterium]